VLTATLASRLKTSYDHLSEEWLQTPVVRGCEDPLQLPAAPLPCGCMSPTVAAARRCHISHDCTPALQQTSRSAYCGGNQTSCAMQAPSQGNVGMRKVAGTCKGRGIVAPWRLVRLMQLHCESHHLNQISCTLWHLLGERPRVFRQLCALAQQRLSVMLAGTACRLRRCCACEEILLPGRCCH
jgi:hypothetical protein